MANPDVHRQLHIVSGPQLPLQKPPRKDRPQAIEQRCNRCFQQAGEENLGLRPIGDRVTVAGEVIFLCHGVLLILLGETCGIVTL
jgi:hypothetical protein